MLVISIQRRHVLAVAALASAAWRLFGALLYRTAGFPVVFILAATFVAVGQLRDGGVHHG